MRTRERERELGEGESVDESSAAGSGDGMRGEMRECCDWAHDKGAEMRGHKFI